MKTMIRLITLGAALTILALPLAAKNLASTEMSLQDQCSQDSKSEYYKTFRENFKTDQAKAYENAKKYLACPADDTTEASQNIINYLKKFVVAYEQANEEMKLPVLLYNEKKYQEAYELGRKVLERKPDDLKVMVDLGANGYLVANNPALKADALNYAKKSLALLDSGKTVENWSPLAGRDEAVAYLSYTVGVFTITNDPSSSLKSFIKAAQFDTPLKKSPQTYVYIATAYEAGPYAKLSEEYKSLYEGKDETPESKLALANINQIVDRMIDAYARAVALAGSDPKYASPTQKPAWNDSLAQWYKYRHNGSPDGMNEMIASVLSKPLPPEPTPLTSLPTAEPATTPIGTSGSSSPNNATASAAAPNSGPSAAASPSASKPAAKTTTTTGPGRPKNNHR